MKNKFNLLVLALFASISVPLFSSAQPFVDLVSVKGQLSPATPFANDPSHKLSVKQFEGNFLLPMEQKNKDVILFGGNYTQLSFTGTSEAGVTNHSNLYSTSLALGYEKQWKNSKWKTTLLALPKFNSDNISLSGNDFQMGGILLFNYKKKENLKYHFGLYYNKEFFGDFVIPLLGIDWKINDKMNLYGDLPISLTYEYKISKSFYTGATFYSTIASYRLNEGNGNMYVRDGDPTLGRNELKVFVNCYVTKHIVWFVEAGHTLARMYQQYDENNELMTNHPIYRNNGDGMFFNTGLAFRIRLDEK